MKKFLLSFPMMMCMLVLGQLQAQANDITTTFAGNPTGTKWTAGQTLNCAEGGLSWTTSGQPNSFDTANGRGIQFSKTSSVLATTVTGKVSKITVVASTNGDGNTMAVTVAGKPAGETVDILKGTDNNNASYEFVLSPAAEGEINVILTSGGEAAGKSIYVKAITVSFDGEGGGSTGDTGGTGDTGDTGDTPGADTYTAPLTDTQGDWTFEDITLPADLTYIWQQDTRYGMKASAYKGQAYDAESYLISPVIELGTGSVLTFEHVQKNGSNWDQTETLWIREKGATRWAAQLTIPTYADGTNWTYVSSGDIDLSAYAGKQVQLGWRYISTTEGSSTWELKNVQITHAKAATESVITDPTNTPATAYTVDEAVNMVKEAAKYDLSKKIYVKGIVVKTDSYNSKYGSITYWISADGTDAGTQLQVYGGLNFQGSKFNSQDDLQDGDEVIVYGIIKKYNEIIEMDMNNELYSLNGNSSDKMEIVVDPTASAAAGSYLCPEALTITLACTTEGAKVYYSLDGSEPTTEYTGAISLNAGSYELKMIAKTATAQSNVVTANYTICGVTATGITNGDMEAWNESTPEGWTSVTTASSATLSVYESGRSGKAVAVAGAKGSNKRLGSNELTLAPGWYTFTAYVKDITEGGETAALAALGYVPMELQAEGNYKVGTYSYAKTEDGKATAYTALSTSEWTKLTYTFEIQSEQVVSMVVMNHYADKNNVYNIAVDDIELRPATEDEIPAATGITGISATFQDGVIYNIAGQRVSKALKGVYIMNGKKVLVK